MVCHGDLHAKLVEPLEDRRTLPLILTGYRVKHFVYQHVCNGTQQQGLVHYQRFPHRRALSVLKPGKNAQAGLSLRDLQEEGIIPRSITW